MRAMGLHDVQVSLRSRRQAYMTHRLMLVATWRASEISTASSSAHPSRRAARNTRALSVCPRRCVRTKPSFPRMAP
jgi:hypothetical protein